MLSVFPEILFLSPVAPFLIRLALAALFAHAAWNHVQRTEAASRVLSLFEVAAGVALAVGAWTQPAALLGAIIAIVYLFQPAPTYQKSTVLLALVMCLSLIFTGAGAFAFDLPL